MKEKLMCNPQEKWMIDKNKKPIEIVSTLHEALQTKNLDQVRTILKEPAALRSLNLDRAQGSKNIVVLKDSFDLLFLEKFGPKADIFSVAPYQVIEWIHEINWPEDILNEMMGAAYHDNDHALFFRVFSIIAECENSLRGKDIMARAQHDLATWHATAAQKPELGIEINKKALEGAREAGDEILEQKAKFGLTYNKNIKPKDKAEEYENIAQKLEQQGDEYDAIRAMIEASRAYVELAKRKRNQKDSSRFDNLDLAHQLALESYKKAMDISYSNATYKACIALAAVYSEKGDIKKAVSFQKKADQIKKETEYKY